MSGGSESADEALWLLAINGDGAAFGALYDRHRDQVLRHALRLVGSPHQAEDITAIVFYEAWRRRKHVRIVNGSIVAWLLVTTNNTVCNHNRQRRRYRAFLEQLPPPCAAEDVADEIADSEEREQQARALRAAFAQLKPQDRDVLTLCVIEGLHRREVAAALGIAEGTVKSRLHRAKNRLGALYKELDPPPAYNQEHTSRRENIMIPHQFQADRSDALRRQLVQLPTAVQQRTQTRKHWGFRVAAGTLRRRWVTSVAAAAVLAALVAGDIVGLAGWRGGATAEAAEVLNTAAETAITSTDPVVKPGQYLRIKSTNVWSTDAESEDGSRYQWLDTEKMDMYVPADRTTEWVWLRSGRVPTTFFDDKARNYVQEQGIQAHPETLRAPKGEFYGPGGALTTDMSAFPLDAYRLLNHIYIRTLGAGQSVDGEALVFIADLLRTGLVPADLRAALFKAAAMIPGVTITEGQANLDGRTGVAIGRTEGTFSRQEIIIDPKTGQLIGEREVLTEDFGVMPAGTTWAWTAVETSVSDTAP
jgi:RNA polymerase sigma-70 factor (ECF subfamily)